MTAAPLLAHPLTSIRTQHGWTLGEVAEIVARRSGVNMAQGKQKVWRWEHRRAVPEMAAQLALAAELKIPPCHVQKWSWPDWLHIAYGVELERPWDMHWALMALMGSVDAAMDRRRFLTLSQESACALAGAWAIAPEQIVRGAFGRRVDPEVADWIETRIAELWHLDDLVGGECCLDLAVSELRLAIRLLSRGLYSGEVERRLYISAAELCRFAGWAAFDAGRHAAAERYWHAGLRAAATAAEPGVGAYILSQMAMQRTYAGDGHGSVRLLKTAREKVGPGYSRTVHAMLDAWQVRAHAVAGEAREAARVLLQADGHWGRRHPEEDPPWIYWMRRPSTTIEVGMAFARLGQPETAEELISDGMAERTSDYERDRVLGWTAIALARLDQGEVDGALTAGRQAAAAAASIDSSRVLDEMDAFTSRLPGKEREVFKAEIDAIMKPSPTDAE
ncbi:hypothetical protein [Spongiactinospora sp. 9N601]|uniref:hypothetical protein n=1 Tax=Spongiactinospora sp. 9N601 TaxID=3375149 RepID=UPI0037A3E948